MTIGQKIALTLGVLALAVLAIGIHAERQLDFVGRQTRQVVRLASERLDPILNLSEELRTYQRVISEAAAELPGPVDMAPIEEAEHRLDDDLASLRSALEDQRAEGDEFHVVMDDGILAHLTDVRSQLGEAARRMLASESTDERDGHLAGFMTLSGIMGSAISVSASEAIRRMGDAFAELRLVENKLDDVMLMWWVAFIGLLTAHGLVLLHMLRRPIRSLARGVSAIRERRFDHRVPVFTHDELGAVAEGFNSMAEELESLYQSLEEKVEAQTEEIRRTYAALEKSQKLAGIGTLAAGVAHEINNPLEAVTVSLDGLLRDVDAGETPDPADLRESIRVIQSDLGRCQAVIGQLLEFSRQRPARAAERSEAVDLRPVLEGAADLVPHSRGADKVRLRCHVDADSLAVRGDPHQLRQVILNLMINAIEASEPGGEIRVSGRIVDGGVEVTISDDGVGIDRCDLPHLFEPFYTTKAGGSNSGLGLSVVHGIVTAHGGQIVAESAGPGRGATFVLTLPAVEVPSEP
ncbi:HAMP domain-containing protein [Candidatus Sumerlaeota bacterium]|nr:HAMP domain-containing protein [Candidatus Sumerlaeota bacterium]